MDSRAALIRTRLCLLSSSLTTVEGMSSIFTYFLILPIIFTRRAIKLPLLFQKKPKKFEKGAKENHKFKLIKKNSLHTRKIFLN